MFVSRVRKVNFNELPLRIQILYVKSSKDCYYLELKTDDHVLEKRKKKKDSIYKKIMFIHIEYSLQAKIHQYYNEVQDTLQIDTRVVFIHNLIASYGDVN